MLRAIRDLAPELAALFTLPTVNTPLCSGGIIAFILQRVRSKVIMWVAFCFALLSIYNLTSQLQSELCFFYLDTGTLGEVTEQVLSDAEELGLSLNHSKYEVKTQLPGMSYCLDIRSAAYPSAFLHLLLVFVSGITDFPNAPSGSIDHWLPERQQFSVGHKGSRNDTVPLWIPCLKGNGIP